VTGGRGPNLVPVGCLWRPAAVCPRLGSDPSVPGGNGAMADPMWHGRPGPRPDGHGFGSIVCPRVDQRCGRECSQGQDGGAPGASLPGGAGGVAIPTGQRKHTGRGG